MSLQHTERLRSGTPETSRTNFDVDSFDTHHPGTGRKLYEGFKFLGHKLDQFLYRNRQPMMHRGSERYSSGIPPFIPSMEITQPHEFMPSTSASTYGQSLGQNPVVDETAAVVPTPSAQTARDNNAHSYGVDANGGVGVISPPLSGSTNRQRQMQGHARSLNLLSLGKSLSFSYHKIDLLHPRVDGGLRGASILIILDEMMKRLTATLREDRELANIQLVKPCQVYDLMGGTGFGGIIAILLGRLRLSTTDAIAIYSELFSALYQVEIQSRGMRSKILETKLKEIVKLHTGDEDTPLFVENAPGCADGDCKT